jgi:hypothetical protein
LPIDWLVWLSVYRNGPATEAEIERHTRVPTDVCQAALESSELAQEGSRVIP